MRLTKPIFAVAAAAALVTLAACGSSSSPGSTGGPSTPPGQKGCYPFCGTTEGQDPSLKAPAAKIPGAKKGGTLTVLSDSSLNTMDPTEAYYTNTSSILSGLVTRSLTQYVYDNKTGDMILVPDLATNLGTHNANYTSWTFTLRSGIKFQNGQPVTPADIKYGIERSFDRATFPTGANYSNQYFLDGATYKGPYKSGTNYPGVVINGMNITIKMSKPFPAMPYWGAFPAMGPIPPGAASNPATYKLHPWATGPYKFASYTPTKSLTLVKNPEWNPNTDPGRRQYVNQIDMNFQTEDTQIDQTILNDSGSGSTTLTYDSVLAASYLQFKSQAGDRIVTGGEPCTFMQYPDNRKITSVKVRQAIGWAWPYKSLETAGGGIENVTWIPATNVMPPGIPGRVPYNPLPGHAPASTNAAKAHSILAAAGQLNYKIIFGYQTDVPQAVTQKNIIDKALKAAGFDPVPYATTNANYESQVLANPNSPVNLRSVGWCSDWPAGSSWMPPEFQSTDIKTDGFGSNYEAFNEPYVDNQINHIQTLPLAQQPAAWNALDKKIQLTWYPVVVTSYGAVAMLRGSDVHGFYDDNTFGMPTWKDIWLS